MSDRLLLRCHDVTTRVGAHVALDGVSLEIARGEIVAIAGRNGAGKTTLLRTLSGDLTPSSGKVELEGASIHAMPLGMRARRRAMLQQGSELSFSFTVREVIAMGRHPFADSESETQEFVARSLEALSLEALAERDITTLSGGERRRAELARVLAQSDPPEGKLLLLDEPVASLDPAHGYKVLEVVRSLAARGAAVVLVLHDLVLADAYASRVVLLERGKILVDGPPREALGPTWVERAFGVEAARVRSPWSEDELLVIRGER